MTTTPVASKDPNTNHFYRFHRPHLHLGRVFGDDWGSVWRTGATESPQFEGCSRNREDDHIDKHMTPAIPKPGKSAAQPSYLGQNEPAAVVTLKEFVGLRSFPARGSTRDPE